MESTLSPSEAFFPLSIIPLRVICVVMCISSWFLFIAEQCPQGGCITKSWFLCHRFCQIFSFVAFSVWAIIRKAFSSPSYKLSHVFFYYFCGFIFYIYSFLPTRICLCMRCEKWMQINFFPITTKLSQSHLLINERFFFKKNKTKNPSKMW